MATYNGAIRVIADGFINIPEPGISVFIDSAPGVTSYSGAKGFPVITGVTTADLELLKKSNIGGGDVIYMEDATTNVEYILQIENIEVSTGVIFLSPVTGYPAIDITTGIKLEFYRGNYNPTTGSTITSDGYTGAGNSEGYNIVSDQDATGVKVLTVNNDLVTLFLPRGKASDLLVVKVLENPVIGPGDPAKLLALRVQ